MKSADYILALLEQRKNDPSETWRRDALLVQKLMNGDLWTPVFEDDESNPYAVAANLALQNLEQMVKRTVSTQPNVQYISNRPGQRKADAIARQRRMAALGFWDQNKMKLQDRKRVRWLQGYGTGPMQLGPHPKLPIPKWTRRNPLSTYPAPCDEQDGYTPHDAIFTYQRTFGWLRMHYPMQAFDCEMRWQSSHDRKSPPSSQMFDIVEYLDAEERVLLLTHSDLTPQPFSDGPTEWAIELERVENLIGICPIVAPTTIGIDRVKSPYVDNVGMYIMRSKLAALEYHYARRTVFPDSYFVEPPNSTNGDIIELSDGAMGKIGHLRGGSLENIQMPPDFKGMQIQDRLAEEERTQNATPADFSGQSASNIRTGVRGANIVSAAVDFTIQELQDILSLAKEQELFIAAKIDKTYFNRPKSFNVGYEQLRTNPDVKDYKPGDIWDSAVCRVYYSAAGTDINNLVISGGQRVAQGTMSRDSFMEIDPLIYDPEQERDRIQAETLRQAGFTQLMQPGSIDPLTMAKIAEYVATNEMEWWEAVKKVQEEEQKRQAPQDEEGNEAAIDPNSPEAQDGIVPGSGIQGAPAMEDLASALGNLRRPQMTVNGA